MKRLVVVVLMGLFVLGLSSMTVAGMLDKAVETTEKANTMAKDAKATEDQLKQQSIEAKDASTMDSQSMMDQAKESAKKTVNEKIDNIGK